MSHKCHSVLFDPNGISTGQFASVSWNFNDRHSMPEHFHPEDQLVFASNGVMTVRTREGIWVVPPMRAVWIPALTPHSITMSGNVSMRTLYFLPELVTSLDRKSTRLNSSHV